MKHFLILVLVFGNNLEAQDTLLHKPVKDYFTLDLNGSVMLFPFGTYIIPYNIHVSPGIKLTKHLAATVSYTNFGTEAEYYSKSYAGYGIGVRYDRHPFLLQAELIQMTRYHHYTEWDSWNLRDRKNLNPMARAHIGFRVAPRFTLGLAFSHFWGVKMIGNDYYNPIGNFTQFRKELNNTNLQLFFGLSLGKQSKESR